MVAGADQNFHLCAHNVDTWQQQQGQLYIQLSAAATEELATLTREHRGEHLKVHMEDYELDHVLIQAPIESGHIVVSWPYRHLLQGFPDSPCGSLR